MELIDHSEDIDTESVCLIILYLLVRTFAWSILCYCPNPASGSVFHKRKFNNGR